MVVRADHENLVERRGVSKFRRTEISNPPDPSEADIGPIPPWAGRLVCNSLAARQRIPTGTEKEGRR
jgi:hypothetical protein